MIEIYRLRTAIKNGGASWGDWRYFENQDDFRKELFLALLSELSQSHHTNQYLAWRGAGVWMREFEGESGEGPHVSRVVGADKLVDGEWVEIKAHVVPPQLVYDE